jgi:hypothetical protein
MTIRLYHAGVNAGGKASLNEFLKDMKRNKYGYQSAHSNRSDTDNTCHLVWEFTGNFEGSSGISVITSEGFPGFELGTGDAN